MPNLKFHGATLDETAIGEFYPLNSQHPYFGYFLFHHEKDSSGNFHLKAYAIQTNGDLIKEVTISKDNPTVPIDFSTWLPADLQIGVTYQLGKLPISSGEKIKRLKLSAKKYKNNYVGYKVKIKVDQPTLADFDREINPSPPATVDENDWELQ